MTRYDGRTLYALIPAFHRLRDQERGGALEALMTVLGAEAENLERDIEQRYEDTFIETCAPWVIPYIGDLLDATPLFDVTRVQRPDTYERLFPDLTGPLLDLAVALRGRADVANTIAFRRRKATLTMLDDLAFAVTGWPVRCVEMFRRLGWSQYVREHLRLEVAECPSLRDQNALNGLGGPFETLQHAVDVRAISATEGRYHMKNLALFAWRLRSDRVFGVTAALVPGTPFARMFSPLGIPMPLFTRLSVPIEGHTRSREENLPGPIRPRAFHKRPTAYYGRLPGTPATPYGNGVALDEAPDASFTIVIDGQTMRPSQVRCMNLETWRQPIGEVVGVDVGRGRIVLGTDIPSNATVVTHFHRGSAAAIGGGGYSRKAWQVVPGRAQQVLEVGESAAHGTIQSALDEWAQLGKPNTIISILDDRTYDEVLSVALADDKWLVLEAANRRQPHVRLQAPLRVSGGSETAALTLSGLLVEGNIEVVERIGRLRLVHTTLVPGVHLDSAGIAVGRAPSILVSEDAAGRGGVRVEIAFSITGPLRLPTRADGLWLLDSILDGELAGAPDPATPAITSPVPGEPGAPVWMERSTVLGAVEVQAMALATEVLFIGPVSVVERQTGCVRFSYVPLGSSTPRRYRTQPELAIGTALTDAKTEKGGPLTSTEQSAVEARVARALHPRFAAARYGHPAFGQLLAATSPAITRGAEDGSEMGALSHLKEAQRVDNLAVRLREYLPAGLRAGLIFVT